MGSTGDAQVTEPRGTQTPAPSTPLTTLRPDLLGYACHLAWIYLFLYEPETSYGAQVPGLSPIYLISAWTPAAVFLVGSMRTRPFMRLAERPAAKAAAPLLTTGGTLLYCLCGAQAPLGIVWLCGITTGIGSAFLAARWASVWGNASPRQVMENFPAMLVAIIVVSMSLSYLPSAVRTILTVVLPLLSAACLMFSRRYQHKLPSAHRQGRQRPNEAGQSGISATLRALVAPIALVALMSLLSGTLEALPQPSNSTLPYGALFNGIAAVVVLAYVGLSLIQIGLTHFAVLFGVPALALLAVVLPFSQNVASGLGDVLYPLGSISFELILLFGAVMFALAKDVSPARAFMVARCTRAVFDMVGYAAGSLLAAMLNTVAGIQIASMALLVAGEILVVAVVLLYLTARRVSSARPGGGVVTDETGASGAPELTSEVIPSASGHVRAAMESGDPCATLASQYGLSERELEVVRLLARGKTPGAIQSELCIAQGTVNYHLRNIYAKAGVHSRQELLVLIFDRRPSE